MTEKKSSKRKIWENLSGKSESAEHQSTDNKEKTTKEATTPNETNPAQNEKSTQDLLTHPTYKALEDELTKTEARLTTATNDLTYKLAEMENLKRRCQQDIEKAHKFSSEKIIRDLLPGIDNLERALELLAQGADADPVLKGVELTLQMFRKVLENHGVSAIAPVAGDDFNADFHQAMSMQESAEQKPDSILTILQKGYALHGRLIRPAAVIVAKAPEENS